MAKKYSVFTYGTLMKDFEGYKKYMQKGDYVCSGSFKGHMYHTSSGYPAVIYDEEGTEIAGELYRVDEDLMEQIRRYEGVNSFLTCYEEKELKVSTPDGYIVARGFVVSPYWKILIRLSGVSVESGDWRSFLSAPVKKPMQPIVPLIISLISFMFIFNLFL